MTTPVGRPRKFDADQALDAALKVFWRKGFDGTSLSDLTKAMGINRPSLYATFGDKQALFRQAMQRYVDTYACHVTSALDQSTARAVVEALWSGSIALGSNPRNPRGCFLVQGALACDDQSQPVQRAMARQRAKGEVALRERFEQAIAERDLPADTDAADLARYVSVVSHGLAVQAASGVKSAELQRVADIALCAIPSK